MNDLSGIRYGPQILAAASAHSLDPKLLAAVAAQETGGPGSNSGNNIVGDGGHGRGLFQIDDRSWDFARTPGAMDPAKNADQAASILQDNLGRYGGNVKAALSAYNTGSPTATGTTTTWGDGQTLGYADSVLRHYADLGGGGAGEQLVADKLETSNSVNALAAFGDSQVPAGAALAAPASPGTASSSSTVDPNLLAQATTPPAQPSFTAPVSWAQEMGPNGPAGGSEAAASDLAMANLVDPGDLDGNTNSDGT